MRSFIKGVLRGAKPLFLISFPLSFEGEGDKGGEVAKQSQTLLAPLLTHVKKAPIVRRRILTKT